MCVYQTLTIDLMCTVTILEMCWERILISLWTVVCDPLLGAASHLWCFPDASVFLFPLPQMKNLVEECSANSSFVLQCGLERLGGLKE